MRCRIHCFKKSDFVAEAFTDKGIRPYVSAQDAPALKISRLGFVEQSRQLIDSGHDFDNRKLVGAQLAPSVHIPLSKVRILKKPPEPGVLPIVELGPVPSFGVEPVARVGIAKAQVPVPDRAHLQPAAAVLVVKGAEAKPIDILGELDQEVVVDERIRIDIGRVTGLGVLEIIAVEDLLEFVDIAS